MSRDTFHQRIHKGLIGPGSDSFGCDDLEELISDYPLQRYFSGIIFPQKKISLSQDEEDENLTQSETEGENIINDDIIIEYKGEGLLNEDEEKGVAIKESSYEDDKMFQNHFYPNNIGLTFCLGGHSETISVEFSGGLYYVPEKIEEIKIRIPEIGFMAFQDDKAGFPFKDILKYDSGYMSLTKSLKGEKIGKLTRTEDFRTYDEYKKTEAFKDSSLKNYIHYFDKLIGRIWKRKEIQTQIQIRPLDTSQVEDIPLGNDLHKDFKIGYHVKTYTIKKLKFVKVQLINLSKEQAGKRFTPKTHALNEKCLFQAKIKVKSNDLVPYKSNQELNPFDQESEELNYLYKDVLSYGIGHNTAVVWDESNNTVETTFLPEHDIRDTKNDFNKEDFENQKEYEMMIQCLDLHNLTIFSTLSKSDIISNLNNFNKLYNEWIKSQKEKCSNDTESERKISKKIIERLEYNNERIQKNINCLQDDKVFRTFQLANTAMLIQIIISNDIDFTKKEKDISEINAHINYNDINFFKNYNYKSLDPENKIEIHPKYRPFQLAFLLLNIEGITQPDSEDRKDVVDLIWFPTGGGKTEAYLAVSAFTIIWRRMNHSEQISSGVSVIMRYTLRLLTAQQFERASKLIAALEFLRKNFPKELKNETISIGLWVGNQLTPGSVEGAKKVIDEIEFECNKSNGNPESKNTFQISACPWCGTKLVSKLSYGFEEYRKDFIIKCMNSRCTYQEYIPLQVVDEMLYKKPPTLLFATVDKFAQLAWKGEANVFFNSLNNEKLPPDLIIQDELHLLSGPLGSIVGLFEGVVESLCTNEKKNLTPKIIASTATTRNTTEQIAMLYGRRKVNIFPPSGISYKDSYFARVSKNESKRKYIGFMPVGKTSVDTQLQSLAHLLESRIENNGKLDDRYWTIVSYYNSLKDVGKIRNKVGDEITTNTSTLQARLHGRNNMWNYNHYGLEDRTEELTARVESTRIKSVLKLLENKVEIVERLKDNGETYKVVSSSVIDLVLATNMFSVGIDIGRLNLMLMNGMPKNIAEYIQATSRVGRQNEGLVMTLLDPNRSRDKSYFEHFVPFHQAYYKNIEPLSITPFTENTIDKMLTTLMIAYLRQKNKKLNKEDDAGNFIHEDILHFLDCIMERFKGNKDEMAYFQARINFLAKNWEYKIKESKITKYSEFIKRPSDVKLKVEEDWVVMQSMREVDAETFIQVKF